MSARRDQPLVDDEAALEHPVVGDELADEFGHRRARPRHPAVALEEPPLSLARQQRLAVVQLQHELDPAADRLDRVEQPEAGAAEPRRQRRAAKDASAISPASPEASSSGSPNGIPRRVSTGLPKVISEPSPSLRR